ncbi:MAG: hypothetical protein ACK53H_02680, partial [Betaproteobacteria bacterium]
NKVAASAQDEVHNALLLLYEGGLGMQPYPLAFQACRCRLAGPKPIRQTHLARRAPCLLLCTARSKSRRKP